MTKTTTKTIRITSSPYMHEDIADMLMEFLDRTTAPAWEHVKKLYGGSDESIERIINDHLHPDHVKVVNALSNYQVQMITAETIKALDHINGGL